MSRRGQSLGATLFYDEIEQARRRTKMMLFGVWLLMAGVWFSLQVVLGAFYTTKPCPDDVCVEEYTGAVATTVVTGWEWDVRALAMCFIIPTLYMIIAWLWSSRAALAIAGARKPVENEDLADAHALLAQVSIAAGIAVPQLWIVDDDAPNAFATGRDENNAHVAVTTGLLKILDRRELEGVLAHEVAHIANRDVQVTTIAVLAAGIITTLAEALLRIGSHATRSRSKKGSEFGAVLLLFAIVLYIFAVPAALLLRAGISRTREALADATAVELTRNPSGLRQALQKLQADETVVSRHVSATNHLWIESPTDRSDTSAGFLGRMLDTHPPLSERIEILMRMEGLDPDGTTL